MSSSRAPGTAKSVARRLDGGLDEIKDRPGQGFIRVHDRALIHQAFLALSQTVDRAKTILSLLSSPNKAEKVMNPKSRYNPVAVDVSKKTLQVQLEDKGFNVSNDAKGHQKLIDSMKNIQNPLVVFEASGGYERPLKKAMHHANIALCLVNPTRVRAFAISEGIKAKTDPIDAKVIRSFALEKNLKATKAIESEHEQLAALLDRRSQLSDHLTKEKNRLDKSEEWILPFIRKMIHQIEEQINTIELAIRNLIKSQEALSEKNKAIQEIDGIGEITTWSILAYMSEMTTCSRNEAVCLAGLAPFNRDSGSIQKPRHIFGGRSKIRTCLYMAAQMAARYNHVIKPYVEGLRERGKPYKCAIVAAMRKLLLHIRSILKKLEKSLA